MRSLGVLVGSIGICISLSPLHRKTTLFIFFSGNNSLIPCPILNAREQAFDTSASISAQALGVMIILPS